MRRLLSDITAVLGFRYAVYLALLTASGLTEAVSLAAVVPLLAAVGVGSTSAAAGTIGTAMMSVIAAAGLAPTTGAVFGVVLVALLASTTLFMAQAYLGARLQTLYVYRWQERLSYSLFRAQWTYFQTRRQGDLVNALITEPARLGSAFYQVGLLLSGLIHTLLFLTIAAVLSTTATVLLIGGGTVLFLVTRPLVRRSYGHGTGIADANAELQGLATELIGGAKLVKATATEDVAARLVTGSADRLRRHTVANAFDIQVIKGTFDFGAAAIGIGLLVASRAVLRADPAVTLVVLAIFVRLMPKLTSIQHGLQALAFYAPAVEGLQRVAAEADAAAERASAGDLPDSLREGPIAVALRGVDVNHGTTSAVVDATLEVPAGAWIGIVGGSGAGKSTLVDAMLGLAPVSRGEIGLNGVAIGDLPLPQLRRRIGYVGQETVLYNGTIRQNVEWAWPGATDEECTAALGAAGAAGFVARLPHGSATVLGDRGMSLSGGERQRLGLARAVIGRPGLLILDEATNALDAEAERSVIDAVAGLKGRTTIIMIAHRLSSLRLADTIHVLEAGRLIERGTWSELMEYGGRFRELWALQHAEEPV